MKVQLQLLMVEDSDTDAELVARNLSKSGLDCSIRRVWTEREFLTALQHMKPDLILSDFALPEFSGLRALELAVMHAPDTPFIYVSGTIGEERAIDALRRGATDYVLKTNLSRLSSAVERALREASLKAAQRRSEQLRQEQAVRLKRLTRTYRMLSSTSSAILRLRSRIELLDEVCRIAVHQGGYQRASICLLESDGTLVRPRACADSVSADFTSPDPGLGAALAERSIRSDSPAVINELEREPRSMKDYEALVAHGYRASAALPLIVDGTAVGAISLFSSQTNVFDQAEMHVLLELTANLGFGLQYLAKDEAVHFLSYFDSLTGLAKRPLFCQRVAHMLGGREAPGGRTIVVFDVQKLGAINDSLGRYVGDRLLEKIAMRLKQTHTESETIAYFGGGTFGMILGGGEDTDSTGRMLQNAAAQLFVDPFELDGEEMRPAIRSGIAFYPHDGNTAEALVQNAEAALKAAREENEKYKLYGLVTRHPTSRSLALEARLSGALERHEFLLHYQPKLHLESGRLMGFEALLRWRDAQDGLVPPSIFVPLLEHSGAIVDVGEWVIMQAVRDIRSWFSSGLIPVRVAVNVSPLQLRRRDFVDRVLENVEPVNTLAAGGIDIEITESMLMQDLELSISKLAQLRAAGIGVAIDDFGTGYSSLCLLARLPVDTLKIDRSFIQALVDTPNGMTLVSTIVSLARAFNMRTVAEGVETVEQLEMLRLIQCDQAQGFYFGKPTPASEIPSIISRLSRDTSQHFHSNAAIDKSPGIAKQSRS